MARTKRRLTRRELKDLEKIESLIQSTKTNKKQELINEAKQILSYGGNEVDVKQIYMSEHAILRARQRFNMDEKTALSYFRSILLKAKPVGLQFAEDGSESILFALGKVGIYVTPNLKRIKTVMKQEAITYEPIKVKVAELHAKEIRKITRKENIYKKRLKEEILEVGVEIAQLELRQHRTRSQSVKNACISRIRALKMHIADKENELENLKNIKRQIARSMISVV